MITNLQPGWEHASWHVPEYGMDHAELEQDRNNVG